jgi:hypothetical protein
MNVVDIPVSIVPGGHAQGYSPVVQIKHMPQSVTDLFRLLIGNCIGIGFTQLVWAMADFLYQFDLDFAQTVSKFPVVFICNGSSRRFSFS